jgi:hypothetical protein
MLRPKELVFFPSFQSRNIIFSDAYNATTTEQKNLKIRV